MKGHSRAFCYPKATLAAASIFTVAALLSGCSAASNSSSDTSASNEVDSEVIAHSGNPFLVAVGASFTQALEAQGVKVVTCDGKGNPVDVDACISQAVAQYADAIQVDGPEPKTYSNALATAQAAGIPVMSGAALDASGELYDGLAAQSSQPFELTGALAADWIIRDSGGEAKVLSFLFRM